jgi:Protein of unknown function (DUF2946)
MLSSFMPTISHAVQDERLSSMVLHEVCTGEGLKTVAFAHDETGGQQPAKHQDHAQDCPYCRLQSDSPPLPTSLRAILHPLVTGTSYPCLFYASPERLFVWVSANPRGPPRFS